MSMDLGIVMFDLARADTGAADTGSRGQAQRHMLHAKLRFAGIHVGVHSELTTEWNRITGRPAGADLDDKGWPRFAAMNPALEYGLTATVPPHLFGDLTALQTRIIPAVLAAKGCVQPGDKIEYRPGKAAPFQDAEWKEPKRIQVGLKADAAATIEANRVQRLEEHYALFIHDELSGLFLIEDVRWFVVLGPVGNQPANATSRSK